MPTAKTMTNPSLARMLVNRSRNRRWRRGESAGAGCTELTRRSRRGRRTDAVDRPDEPRLVAVLAELAADARDVGVDDPSAGEIPVPPHLLHQLLPREDDT